MNCILIVYLNILMSNSTGIYLTAKSECYHCKSRLTYCYTL